MKLNCWAWILFLFILLWTSLGLAQEAEPLCLRGHTNRVNSVAFSPDGRFLASGSDDNTIKLWDVGTGACLCTLTGHSDAVNAVAFSPDGKSLASGSRDDTIKLWDVETGDLMVTFTGHNSGVLAVAFSPDDKFLASGSSDQTIRLWDTATRECLDTLLGHNNRVSSVAFNLNGVLASASWDSTVKLWDVATGECMRTLTGHTRWVRSVAFSPDGRHLASGSWDDTIKLWDVATGECMRTLTGHMDSVFAVVFNPDGTLLASGAYMKVKLWDVVTGESLCTLTVPTGSLWSVVFSPDGRLLASGSIDMTLRIWDVDAILHPNELPTASFTWQALSASGTRVVVEPRTGDHLSFDASASSDPDGNVVKYEWDWESDGSYDASVTDSVVDHVFSQPGSHRVTLQVTDDDGGTATLTKTITVGEIQPPNASFTFSLTEPSILDTVQFADTSTDADGDVASWSWTFGDGSSSTVRNPSHQYTQKKTYTVKLTVTDDDGLTNVVTKQLMVVNIQPGAAFTFSPQQPYVNQPLSFDATVSQDKDGTITGYSWDFDGDGNEDAHGEKAVWTFTKEGTYTAKLTVTDDDGDAASNQEEITVKASPSGLPRFEDLWAVVIGVGEYEDSRLDLGLPEGDAQAVYDFLVDTRGGGFPKDNVRLLVNEQATRKGIEQAWGWLLQQASKEDLVLVYFSGHGGHDHDYNGDEPEGDTEDEYLLPYDTDPSDFFSTAVRDDAVGDWVSSLRSEHVILIFDSCHSGGAAKTVKSYETPGSRAGPGNTVFTDLMGVDGVLVMTACQATELAQQDDSLGYGVFTYFLLSGLGGLEKVGEPEADTDQDGRVTVEELKRYLQREVPQYVSDVMLKTSPQNPLITGDEALSRVALSGYGVPLIGEVTAIDEERVIITLGSRHGIQPGDRFEVVHILELPDGQTMEEHRAIIEVLYVLGPARSVCCIVETIYPIELRDQVRPTKE